MEKQPGQFGILALFVLMTAAALGFAVVRLEVPVILKLCVVFAIAVCFYGWAVRNRKYPDPRQPLGVPLSPRRRRIGLVVQLVYPLLMAVLLVGPDLWVSGWRMSWPETIMLITIALMLVAGVIRLIRNW